jgi:hypothetical protein
LDLLDGLAGHETADVFVYSRSAICPEHWVQELVIWILGQRGVRLHEIAVNNDLPSNYTIRGITELFRALDRFEKTARMFPAAFARRNQRERGERCEGRKPYGHLPGEPTVIRRMQILRAEGKSFAAIAGILDKEMLQPRGTAAKPIRRWQARTVGRILARVGTTVFDDPETVTTF